MEAKLPVPVRCKRALLRVTPVRSLYHLRRAARDARQVDARHPEHAPIVIYQMAKVGSSTVHDTLRSLDPPRRPTLKVHFLSPDGVRAERAYDRELGGALNVSYHGALSVALSARLRRHGGAMQLPVITLVRDPIAREVSGRFQLPEFARDAPRDASGRFDPERVLEGLARSFSGGGACESAERWFDEELRAVFGVDVFGEPFPHDRGFAILKSDRARVLLMRTEDLDRSLGPALQEFLDLPKEPALVRSNVRSRSDDARAYRDVLSRFRLPSDVVDAIYAERLARHFYPEPMLADFRRRWVGE